MKRLLFLICSHDMRRDAMEHYFIYPLLVSKLPNMFRGWAVAFVTTIEKRATAGHVPRFAFTCLDSVQVDVSWLAKS